MSLRIGRRSRTDVAALHIRNDNEPELLCKPHGLLVGNETRNPELLVHGNLGLHRRNQIRRLPKYRLVKAEAGLCRPLQIFTLLGKRGLLYLIRNIRQHGVQTDANRGLGLFDFFD